MCETRSAKSLTALDCFLQTTFPKIINVPFDQKNHRSIPVKVIDRPFQTLGRAFETLRENQKPSREFENPGRMFEKLGWVFKI